MDREALREIERLLVKSTVVLPPDDRVCIEYALGHVRALLAEGTKRPANETNGTHQPVLIARCPEHGLHGERLECFVCGGPVEQVPMVPAALLAESQEEPPRRSAMGDGGPCMSCGGNDGYGPAPHHAPECYFASWEDVADA